MSDCILYSPGRRDSHCNNNYHRTYVKQGVLCLEGEDGLTKDDFPEAQRKGFLTLSTTDIWGPIVLGRGAVLGAPFGALQIPPSFDLVPGAPHSSFTIENVSGHCQVSSGWGRTAPS